MHRGIPTREGYSLDNRGCFSRMKARRLLPSEELLPTISELQEGILEDGEDEYPTMEEYVDSIKKVSQTAPYPLHGPLRGHRRWITHSATHPVRRCPTVAPLAPYNKSMAYAPQIPSGLSDVSLMVAHPLDCVTRVCTGPRPPELVVCAGPVFRVDVTKKVPGFWSGEGLGALLNSGEQKALHYWITLLD